MFHIVFFSVNVVKVKFLVSLLCVYVCILPEKAIPEMTYTVLGGTLNPTHSLTGCLSSTNKSWMFLKLALPVPISIN